MATQTDYARCLTALEDCRWVQMLVIADAAEDAGDPHLARGWRELARQRCWPKEFSGGHYWSRGGGGWDRPPARRYLPAPAFARLPASAGNSGALPTDQMKAFPGSVTDALEAAARAVGEWLAAAEGGQVGEGVEGVRGE